MCAYVDSTVHICMYDCMTVRLYGYKTYECMTVWLYDC